MEVNEALNFIKENFRFHKSTKQIIYLLYTTDKHKTIIKQLKKDIVHLEVILELVTQNIPNKVKKTLIKYLTEIIPPEELVKKYVFTFTVLNLLDDKILSKFSLEKMIFLTSEKLYFVPKLIYALVKYYSFTELVVYFNKISPLTLLDAFILVFKDKEIEKNNLIPFVLNLLSNNKYNKKNILYSLLFNCTYKSKELDTLFYKLYKPKNLRILSFYKSKNEELIDFLLLEKDPVIFYKSLLRIHANLKKEKVFLIIHQKMNLILQNDPTTLFKKIKVKFNFEEIKYFLENERTKEKILKIIDKSDLHFNEEELNQYYKLIFNNLHFIKSNFAKLMLPLTERKNISILISHFIEQRNFFYLSILYDFLILEEKRNLNLLAIELLLINEEVIYYLHKSINNSLNQDFILKKMVILIRNNLDYKLIKLLNKLKIDNKKEFYFIGKEIIDNLLSINKKFLNEISFFLEKISFFHTKIYDLILENLSSADNETRKRSVLIFTNFNLQTIIPILIKEYTKPNLKLKLSILKLLKKFCVKKETFIFRRIFLNFLIHALSQNDLVFNTNGLKLSKELIQHLQRNELISVLELVFMYIFSSNTLVSQLVIDNITLLSDKLGVEIVYSYLVQGLYHPSKKVYQKYNFIFDILKSIDKETIDQLHLPIIEHYD
ncbi:splicing factor 3B subunit [Tubulinosema ratisbonensis]|uniref:Splicing factor 3B subunit n=1 Tax=Tubulinosema ratisbonensis TaxID=291195 RepID=A0A437AKM3_9MICR|nr:splicing factor 3B subunit [Tubulinosema ratisbonensis]